MTPLDHQIILIRIEGLVVCDSLQLLGRFGHVREFLFDFLARLAVAPPGPNAKFAALDQWRRIWLFERLQIECGR